MDLGAAFTANRQRGLSAPPPGDTGQVTGNPAGGVVEIQCSGLKEQARVPIDLPVVKGDTVAVLRSSGLPLIVARLQGSFQLPSRATLTAATGTTGTFTINNVSYTLPYLASYTSATAGDVVRIHWGTAGGIILGKELAVPPGSLPTPPPPATPAPVPPPGASMSGSSDFRAVDAGSFRDGAWRGFSPKTVSQGTFSPYGANAGAWFYGGAPGSLLTGATVTGSRVKFRRRTGGNYAAQTVHVYRHSSATKPAGDVTRVAGPTDVSIEREATVTVELGATWGQALVDSGHGVGIFGSPYVNLYGLDEDPTSGQLTIDWSR